MTTGRINQVDTILEKFPGPPATPEGAGRRDTKEPFASYFNMFQKPPSSSAGQNSHHVQFTHRSQHKAELPQHKPPRGPAPSHPPRTGAGRRSNPPHPVPTKGTRGGTRPLPHQLYIYRSAEQTKCKSSQTAMGERKHQFCNLPHNKLGFSQFFMWDWPDNRGAN